MRLGTGESRPGPVPGCRPVGSPQNGLDLVKPYRFRGMADWDPAAGRHYDPLAVLPQPPAIVAGLPGRERGKAMQMAAYEERLAAFAALAAEEVLPDEIERLTGLTRATQAAYRRVLRERAEQAAEYSEARDLGFSREEAAELMGIRADTMRRLEREYQARSGGGS